MTMHFLILCTGNSARSILGEALARDLGRERLVTHSAGSKPKSAPHPEALKLLAARGHVTEGLSSKSWDEFAKPGAPAIDIVITVCDSAAAEVCPVWPGAPVSAHWGLPDPAAAPAGQATAAFVQCYDALRRRIEALLALPFETMEPRALKDKLNRIGSDTA